METPPVPPDEHGRLQALHSYGILDTEPEIAFDRLTRLAAEMMGTRMAFISLIDSERQWFKSKIGLDVVETHRSLSFCTHAICQNDPLIVADATLDPRFAGNPLVTGAPHVRFYAGAPLTSPLGYNIGTLCAVDLQPRQISTEQIRNLADLAGAVVSTMELHRALRALEARTYTDTLTGLGNRGRLIDRLDRLLGGVECGFVPFSLIYLDCDCLAVGGDATTPETGGDLPRVVANELQGWVRPTDLAARLGPNQFALLLPCSGEREAGLVAARVLESTTALMRWHDCPVTMSIGVTSFTEPPASPEDVLSIAHATMCGAREAGRQQIRGAHYPPSEGGQPLLRLDRLQQDLRAGLGRGELFLQYQPIVPIAALDGLSATRSVEALVRWRHPTLGVLQPASFIPGAERSGLIVEVGAVVLDMALRQMRAWLDDGTAPTSVSVNVAAPQLRDTGFADLVLRRLEAENVPPERLMIELTEGTLIDGSGVVLETLMTLQRGGVRLAIDDFGTGYSSLRYLRDLPVHVLKIDRTFIKDICKNPRDVSIVSAIVAMARTLDVTTIAEGIETTAQRDLVASLGCDYGQGWLYGRPA